MFEGLEIKHKKILYLQSQSVEAAPPLGTILGNLGVNTVIRVFISVYENRTFSFFSDDFSLTYAIKALKFSKIIKIWHFDRFNDKTIFCVRLSDLLLLLLFKFPGRSLRGSFLVIFGVLRSMKILVEK
jgi:hypothetical protein